MSELYTVKYGYQGQLDEKRIYAENAALAAAKAYDMIVLPLFKHTFEIKEVKLTYAAARQ